MVQQEDLEDLIGRYGYLILDKMDRYSLRSGGGLYQCNWGSTYQTGFAIKGLYSLQSVNVNPRAQAVLTECVKAGRSYLTENSSTHQGVWFRPITVQDLSEISAIFQTGGHFGGSKGAAYGTVFNNFLSKGRGPEQYLVGAGVECCYYGGADEDFLNFAKGYIEDDLDSIDEPSLYSWSVLNLERISEMLATDEDYSGHIPTAFDLYEEADIDESVKRAYFGFNMLRLSVDGSELEDIVEQIEAYDSIDHNNTRELEADLRFLIEFCLERFDNVEVELSLPEWIEDIFDSETQSIPSKRDVFPMLNGSDENSIDPDLSEDSIIEELLRVFTRHPIYRNNQGDIKTHSGYEKADIYPIEVDLDDEQMKMACVVKGPGAGSITWKDISHQITRPALFLSADIIAVVNAARTGSDLTEYIDEANEYLFDNKILYLSNSEVGDVINW